MKRLLLSGTLLTACFTPTATGVDVVPPPAVEIVKEPPAPPVLLQYVKKTNPGLGEVEAERVARLVQQVAEEYEIDVTLFAAIIRQESHFRTGLKACRVYGNVRRCDYGLSQVNSFWIDEMELDAARLRLDDLYNLRIGAQILKDVLDRHPGAHGYGFYNTADPDLRLGYVSRIEKHRKQIAMMLN